jgi:putative redox protein
MNLKINKIGSPYLMELVNEQGNSCLIDASASIGGTDKGLRPMELLAGSLASCISIDVLLILTKQRISTDSYTVEIVGERKEGVPSPFEKIDLVFRLKNEANRPKVERAVKLAIEKYCSVASSLSEQIKINYTIQLLDD